MGVYVVAGKVNAVKVPPGNAADMKKAVEAAGVAAVKKAVDKTAGLQSTQNPKSQDGIRIDLMVAKFEPSNNGFDCTVIGQLFKLPKGEQYTVQGAPRGQGSGATIEACMDDAVQKLVDGIKGEIIGATATATAVAKGAKSRIYIAPFAIDYDKALPAQYKQGAINKVQARAIALLGRHKSQRFFQAAQPPTSAADPAFVIGINLVKAELQSQPTGVKGTVTTIVSKVVGGAMVLPSTTGHATVQSSKPDYEGALVEAAEQAVNKALDWIGTNTP